MSGRSPRRRPGGRDGVHHQLGVGGGDALLPVLAQDRRTAVALTLLTSVPALVVGLLALLVL